MSHYYPSARNTWSAIDATLGSRKCFRRPTLHLPPRSPLRAQSIIYARRNASSLTESGPRIAQPSIWRSIVPKFLRKGSRPSPPPPPRSDKPARQKEWNPFVVYIVIFILVGSNAINLIGVRNDLLNFSQKTERQIAILKDVIRKIQNGEKVDIEAALGTGDPAREQDWEEALKEIESTDALYNRELQRREKRAKHGQPTAEIAAEATTKSSKSDSNGKSTGFY